MDWDARSFLVMRGDEEPSRPEVDEYADLGVRRERAVWDLTALAARGLLGHTLHLHALFSDHEACGRVQVLRVGGASGLVSLPLELELLKSLRVLDAPCCSLLALPPVLPGSLRALHVHGNNIGFVPRGLLAGLPLLEDLSLGGNNLRGSSDALRELEGNASLRRLSVPACNLSELPPRLPPSLTFLDASVNRLAEVPPAVAALPALRTLDLSHNEIRAVPADAAFWAGLPELRELNLAGNSLGQVAQGQQGQGQRQDVGAALSALPALEKLDLRDNPSLRPPTFRAMSFEVCGQTPVIDRIEAVMGEQGSKLAAVGGAQDGVLLFDTGARTWELLEPHSATDAGLPRLFDHTAVYHDGAWLVYGGVLGGAEAQTVADVWRVVAYSAPLDVQQLAPAQDQGAVLRPHARSCHAATVRDGSMYVFGGRCGRSEVFDDLWRLDLTSLQWSPCEQRGEFPGPRRAMGFCTSSGAASELFIFGGEDDRGVLHGDVYALSCSATAPACCWRLVQTKGAGPSPRMSPVLSLDQPRGLLYVFGGWSGEWLTDSYVLDMQTGEWSALRTNLESIVREDGTVGMSGAVTQGAVWLCVCVKSGVQRFATILRGALAEFKTPDVLV